MAVNGYYDRKKRNAGTRERKPIIHFSAEGRGKTETLYFRDFARDVGRVVQFAKGGHTDPVNMVTELKKSLEECDFSQELGDKAYCLIDADLSPSKDPQLAKADEIAKRAGIQIIVSSPCFEYWFICHFDRTGKKYLSNSQVIDDLKRYIPGYRKSAPGMYELLKDDLPEAVSHAKAIERTLLNYGEKLHTVSFSPSSEVYHIAEELSR